MSTEDYVSFEIAKMLKEKGFNEQCRAAYTNYGKLFTTQIQQYITNILCSKGRLWDCTAPTHQMAMKWLREEHNISIELITMHRNCWGYYVCKILDNTIEDLHDRNYFNTYEEAVEAALKYCLENLI